MKLNDKKREILIVGAILIIQTILFTLAGINKSYIHMDEAYSLGLASYDKTEIQENDDFYDSWHNKEYYEDYLTVNEDEKYNFSQVYENQKNDVHPPLYYLLLRIAMGFHIGSFSKWTGIILNIIIYIFVTIFTYLIIKKLLEGQNKYKEKSAILTLLSSLTLASINNVIYIRMYALSTLNIVITTYLHLKLLDKKTADNKILLLIGLSTLAGILTHYYYLFYLAMLFIMFVIKYVKEKNFKNLKKYIGTILISGLISLLIFPYSIQHILFGNRGQGVISNLLNISEFFMSIVKYFLIIDVYAFNNILFIILILSLGIIIYKKSKKMKIIEDSNKYIKYIAYPTFFYLILVALSSPWKELRYIMPVCNLLFIITMYFFITLLKSIVKEKVLNKIMCIIVLLMIIMPVISNKVIDVVIGKDFRNEEETSYSSKEEMVSQLKKELKLPINLVSTFMEDSIDNSLLFIKDFRIEPEVLYSNKRYITETLTNDLNLPTLYLFNSNTNRFLDDILLFSKINSSYIAKDVECSGEWVRNIMKGKDISNGIIVFVDDGQENSKKLDIIKNALNFEKITYLKRLNACDVYLVK